MSRASRDSLLADDSLGASSHAYSDIGGADRASSGGSSSGLLRTWWRDPRKRLYLIVASFSILVLLTIIVAYVAVTSHSQHSPNGPPPQPPYNPETPWLYPRLPNTTIPSHYALTEHIYIADSQYHGTVNITVAMSRPTDRLVLHALGLACGGVVVVLDNGTVVVPTVWSYAAYDYLVLNFTEVLPVQRAAVIRVDFSATLSTFPYAGLYAASYTNASGGTVWMAVTQFAATDARRAFPCFDEPAMKATFDLTIVSQPAWPTVLSNMPAIANYTRPDGLVVTVFDTTPIMSTYLLAFTVNDFVSTSAVSNCSRPITTRVFAPPHLSSWTNVSAQIGAAVLAHYCQYFEMDYPLPKEDHFVVPQFFYSAMENWGLIAYRFDALLLQPGGYTVQQLQRVAQVVAHELAHQWFGNLVTAAWWSENFVQYIGMEWAVPMLDARDQFLLLDESAAMAFDSDPKAHPVIDLTTSSGNFDRADYQKGASLLRMLEGMLGPAVWLKGINAYIQAYKYSNARSVDLFAFLTQAANDSGLSINVADFMATWTQVAGFPLVSCTTSSAGVNSTNWQCTQQRYYANPPPANPDTSTVWPIHVALASSTPMQPIHWRPASQPTLSFTAPTSAYVKLNANSTGYYRVMYDDWGWTQLGRALNASGFGGMSADDRLGVVMDVLVFARDERLSWAVLLPLLQFLQYETNWPVWTIAAPSLLNVYKLLVDKTDGVSALYRTYLQQQFRLIAQSLNTSRFDTVRDKSLYAVLGDAIVRFDVGGRRQEFVDRFAQLRTGALNVSGVAADELDLVLQCGVWSSGGSGGALFVFNEYYVPALADSGFERVDPTGASSYAQLLRAIASSSDADEIDLLINLFAVQNASLPVQHRALLMQYLAQSDVARPRLGRYVQCCLPTLNATLGEPLVGRVLYTLLTSQWDAYQLALLNSALDVNKAVMGQATWDAVAAGRVIANENVEYSVTVYPAISTFISSMQWSNG